MGLFDRFRRRAGDAPAVRVVPDEPAEPPPPPVAIVVVREGMSVAPPDYVDAVIAGEHPELEPVALEKRTLSQPVWFQNPDAMQAAATAIAVAYQGELGIDPGAREYHSAAGPDGARVLVVLLYR